MSDQEHGTGHIIQSLVVNLAIGAIKTVAAVLTKSGSMLAEALHSFSDCGNQVLLLVGVRQAKKPPDRAHPLGYGRAVYFWSFMVALLLFTGGGVFSIYEGIHKLHEPEPVERAWLGLGILGVSILLEGAACFSNIRELNRRRKDKPFFQYLRATTDSDLVVVFGENSAAVIGLILAFAALGLAAMTGDGRWDGGGSIAIGVVLIAVAVFLAVEVSSLLLGESADPDIDTAARETARELSAIDQVLHVVTMQQGPGEVLLHVKLAFATPTMSIEEACGVINDYEARLRQKRPEVRWVFVEPDMPRTRSQDRPRAVNSPG